MESNRRKGSRGTPRSLLKQINPNAAGIDCGSAEHYVAVPIDRDATPVRRFKTFTGDLYRLADWLTACGVSSVAMEATGVYWIPVYEILEARGFGVLLVNARHVKNVPGRKSDVTDCEWLRELHSVGLLRGSFRPTAAITALRGYLRQRDTLVKTAATAVHRMQKALVQMNLQLHLVISDITGMTGLRILRDIVAGNVDPQHLAQHRDDKCRATEACLKGLLKEHSAPLAPLPRPRTRERTKNQPRFEVREMLHQLTGSDLTQIDAIGSYSALQLISELGTDMSRWPSERHFTSWLTLAPKNKISGGRLLSSKTEPSANRAAAVFRFAAINLARSQTALGAFFRRLAFRIGKAKAVTATARKLAILFYRCLKGELHYQDPGAAAYDAQHRASVLRRLRQRAETLGYTLVSKDTGEMQIPAVS